MKKVLILYNWFLPAFKAGGPIQSLANLVRHTSDDYEYYIVCSNKEFKEKKPFQNIASDTWLTFESKASIYYLSSNSTGIGRIRQIIKEVRPDVVFANGMYSLPYAFFPVYFSAVKTVFSARGMFHPGALSQKPLKKKLYFTAFKALRLHKKVVFHATDMKEYEYIQNVFGKDARVSVAGNFPHVQNFTLSPPKNSGSVVLASISLISPMKNHLLVLRSLKLCTSKITYKIYGPIKDKVYWEQCLLEIKHLPDNITVEYKGEVPPSQIPDILNDFHYFILPSKSENFGHAIFEALTAGKPVITSHFTPWNNLQERKAGFNVDIESISSITKAIERAAVQPVEEYLEWRQTSRSFALEMVNMKDLKSQYQRLFDNSEN